MNFNSVKDIIQEIKNRLPNNSFPHKVTVEDYRVIVNIETDLVEIEVTFKHLSLSNEVVVELKYPYLDTESLSSIGEILKYLNKIKGEY